MDIKYDYVLVDQYKFTYITVGKQNNPPIVFLHGLGSTCLSFIEIINKLQDEYFCISIDLAGHGKSTILQEEDYVYPNIIEIIHTVISKIVKERYYIVAHSFGASLVTLYAPLYHKEIIKIVNIDGGYQNENWYNQEGEVKSLDEEKTVYKKEMDNAIYKDEKELLEVEGSIYNRPLNELTRLAVLDLGVKYNKRIIYHLNGNCAFNTLEYKRNYSKTLKNMDFSDVRMLLLRATIPEKYEKMRSLMANEYQLLTGCELFDVIGTSHAMHFEDPDKIYKIVKKYIEK